MSTSPIPPILDQDRYSVYQPTAATTDFALGFPLFGDAGDVAVVLDGAPLALTADYTVRSATKGATLTPAPVTDAFVRLNSPISAGKLEIYGNFRPRRTIQATAPYGTRDFNFSFSLLMAVLREMWSQFTRAIQAPVGESSLTLPAKAARSGQVLGFDSNGDPAAVGDYASIATGAATATAAADRAAASASAAAKFDPANYFPKTAFRSDGAAGAPLLYDANGGFTAQYLSVYRAAADSTLNIRSDEGQTGGLAFATGGTPRWNFYSAASGFFGLYNFASTAWAWTVSPANVIDFAKLPTVAGAPISSLVGAAPGLLTGLTLSYVSAATFAVAPGQATSERGARVAMAHAASITKSLAPWAAGSGSGSLDTGTIAASTWYHVHLIADATGTTDVLLSLEPVAPARPAGYVASRRIGSIKTNSSAQITNFVQVGNRFMWAAQVLEVNVVNQGTAAVTRTLAGVPTGVVVFADLLVGIYGGTYYGQHLVTPLAIPDVAPPGVQNVASAQVPMGVVAGYTSIALWDWQAKSVATNTSAQVRSRVSVSGAADGAGIITLGWTDDRGAI
jgi:hypothetical protein